FLPPFYKRLLFHIHLTHQPVKTQAEITVLVPLGHPCAFHTHKLTMAEGTHNIENKELLALKLT
ncbi:MAG: hypothetical protein ACRC9V_07165, partial [Aeromonas sp.]